MSLARELTAVVCSVSFLEFIHTSNGLITDGAGLACGIFEYLLNLGDNRPKVVAATHFHEIFENGFLEPRPELQFGHMEVQVDERSREIGDQITYLYKCGPLYSCSK